MSDVKKEEKKPIQDEKLDQVSGGVIWRSPSPAPPHPHRPPAPTPIPPKPEPLV
jgi:hypothetical protein